MNRTVGYDFYFYDQTETSQLIVFPITPPKLKLTVGSKNEVVDLINEGEINIPKSPSLTEIEFEARFPMKKYPYSRDVLSYSEYFDVFRSLKENGTPFRFIMIRGTKYKEWLSYLPNNESLATKRKFKETAQRVKFGEQSSDSLGDSNYNILCVLEEMQISEDADEGDDILISFKLRQYKPYGTIYINVKDGTVTTSTSATWRAITKSSAQQEYTIKDGDTLSLIAKKFYDREDKWEEIYNANKNTIENAAKEHGLASSSNGWQIYAGTKIIIPAR